jgi:hypothetical protein
MGLVLVADSIIKKTITPASFHMIFIAIVRLRFNDCFFLPCARVSYVYFNLYTVL